MERKYVFLSVKPSYKHMSKSQKWAGSTVRVVERLPSKCEALRSTPIQKYSKAIKKFKTYVMNQFCQSKSKTGQPLKANESSQIQHLRMQRFNPLITKRESRNITISR
jgi:hypothetical protein